MFFRRSHFLIAAVLAVLSLFGSAMPAIAADPPAGSVTGRVLSPDGVPLEGFRVEMRWPGEPDPTVTMNTDAAGRFSFEEVAPGDYQVHFSDWNANYAETWYGGTWLQEDATVVTVGTGVRDLGDTRMLRLGSISGFVTDPDKHPLARITVEAWAEGRLVKRTSTGRNGGYVLGSLPTTEVKLGFIDPYDGYVSEYWNNKPDLAQADRIQVVPGQVVPEIDAKLSEADIQPVDGAVISGQVRDPEGQRLMGVTVKAFAQGDLGGAVLATATSRRDGSYGLTGLPPAAYTLLFEDRGPDYGSGPYPSVSREVLLTASFPVLTGVDATLEAGSPLLGGRISGEVTDTAGNALAGIKVRAHLLGESRVAETLEARTGADGRYSFRGLEPGTYKVHFTDPDSPRFGELAYAEAWFDGAAWFADATPITVGEGVANDDVDAVLARYGGIRGTVRDADGAPMADVEVMAYDVNGDHAETTQTNADGNYVLDELRAGSYRVWFVDPNLGSFEEWYDDAWGFDDATPVAVDSGEYVENIDAQLTTELTAWEAPRIVGTPQVGVELTADTGRWNYPGRAHFDYTWLRGETVVGIEPTYTPTVADLGQSLRLQVDATTEAHEGTALSEWSEPVRAAQSTPPGPAPQPAPVPQPTPVPGPVEPLEDNSAPVADLVVNSKHVRLGRTFRFDASASRDNETPAEVAYLWTFGDGHTATGPVVRHRYTEPGVRTVTLTVVDPSGAIDTKRVRVGVARPVGCGRPFVHRGGSWRITEYAAARGGRACDNFGARPGKDVMRLSFTGPRIGFTFGRSRAGGVADVIVDGRKRGTLRFHRPARAVRFGHQRVFGRLGAGAHTVRVVMRRGAGHLDEVLLWGAPRR